MIFLKIPDFAVNFLLRNVKTSVIREMTRLIPQFSARHEVIAKVRSQKLSKAMWSVNQHLKYCEIIQNCRMTAQTGKPTNYLLNKARVLFQASQIAVFLLFS